MGNDNCNDDDDDGTNLFKLIRLVEVGDFSAAEDVVDVLQESLLHHLDVIEEEHCGLVLHTALEVQLLQVWGQKQEDSTQPFSPMKVINQRSLFCCLKVWKLTNCQLTKTECTQVTMIKPFTNVCPDFAVLIWTLCEEQHAVHKLSLEGPFLFLFNSLLCNLAKRVNQDMSTVLLETQISV